MSWGGQISIRFLRWLPLVMAISCHRPAAAPKEEAQGKPDAVTSPSMFVLTAEELATNRIAKLYADIPAGEMPRALLDITLTQGSPYGGDDYSAEWAKAAIRKNMKKADFRKDCGFWHDPGEGLVAQFSPWPSVMWYLVFDAQGSVTLVDDMHKYYGRPGPDLLIMQGLRPEDWTLPPIGPSMAWQYAMRDLKAKKRPAPSP